MKHLKSLGLAALATGALMAFAGAGTASATELTCADQVMCSAPTTIHATSEGHATLDSPIGNIQCESTLAGSANTSSQTTTVSGNSNVIFFNCTEGAEVNVLANGTLEIHTEYTKEADGHETQNLASTGNGTLTSTGFEFTVRFRGFHCIFRTSNTDIGTVTGSKNNAGKTATLDINGRIPAVGGESGIFCGTTSPWTGSYSITTPDYLDID
ncbi:MAG TPA: hypothetical protein VFX44_02765 [Solirubrobacterales bacterium]|nr:hypothetical protein [Solirubrobacterales bacterium]